MNFVVLLGAGFSRNWGGWLASEAFEYLLGCDIDTKCRDLLWKHRARGGFEDTLDELRQRARDKGSLRHLEDAVARMFADMEIAFDQVTNFNFSNQRGHGVSDFLNKFDAIFTLNQDRLLEKKYFQSILLADGKRWNGPQLPGVSVQGGVWRAGDEVGFPNGAQIVERGLQPVFKLHGSWNWTQLEGGPLLVIGGNKAGLIGGSGLLTWYLEEFRRRLLAPKTTLVVIGYSFRDSHINGAIAAAAKDSDLRIFIIDPRGVDVLVEDPTVQIAYSSETYKVLRDNVVGASRRSLRESFGGDAAEHGKMMRLFQRP